MPAPRRQRGGLTEAFDAVNPIPPGFDRLSAFRWGDLTSGTPLKAFAAVFTPQLLVNTAGWMMPSSSGWHQTFSRAAIRVAALSTTGFITVGMLWFFYVVPGTSCQLLSIDDGSTDAFRAFYDIPGSFRCRYFTTGLPQWVGVLLALMFAAGLPVWQLFRKPRPVTGHTAELLERDGDGGSAVDSDCDWVTRMTTLEASPSTIWLRRLHLVFAVVTVGLGIAVSNYQHQLTPMAVSVGLTVLVAVTAAVAVVEPETAHRAPMAHRSMAAALLAGPPAVAFALTRDQLLAARSTGVIGAQFNLVNSVVAVGAVALLLLLAQTLFVGERRWAHLAATSVAGLSLLASGVLAAALGYLIVVFLGVSQLRAAFGGNLAVAIAFTIALSLTVAALGWAVVRQVRRSLDDPSLVDAAVEELRTASPEALVTDTDRQHYRFLLAVTTVARTEVRTLLCWLCAFQLVGWAVAGWSMTWIGPQGNGPPVAYFVLVGLPVLAAAAAAVMLAIGAGVGHRAAAAAVVVTGCLLGLFMWRLAVAPLATLEQVAFFIPLGALLVIVYHGFTDSDSRRGIGIVADLSGFWPRTFHPLTPRPYSGIAIGELRKLLENTKGPTVVAAHSQGSVLATLALTGVSPARLNEMALITYGSPLGYFYPTMFPAQFVNDEWVRTVSNQLDGRWVNLGRHTDPITSQIAALPDTCHSTTGDTAAGQTGGNCFFPDSIAEPSIHSDYELERPFTQIEAHFARTLTGHR